MSDLGDVQIYSLFHGRGQDQRVAGIYETLLAVYHWAEREKVTTAAAAEA